MDDMPFEDLILPTESSLTEKDDLLDTTSIVDESFSELFEKYDKAYNLKDTPDTSVDFKNGVVESVQSIVQNTKEGTILNDPMNYMKQDALTFNNETLKKHHEVHKIHQFVFIYC